MKKLHETEKELIEKICQKHNLKTEYIETLIKLEKEYANKNMTRRGAIFKQMKLLIDYWTEYN